MGVTIASWLTALQALLPPGRAFNREPGTVLTRLLEAIAAMLLSVQLRLEAQLVEWDPRDAGDMLPDWERLLGLPDTCTANQAMSEPDRQRLAYQRLVEQGGQSREYFIEVASQLGEPGCTITEFRPFTCNGVCDGAIYSDADAFAWRLNIPHAASPTRVMHCNDDCSEALQLYTPNLMECPIRERRPAHTSVLFTYTA